MASSGQRAFPKPVSDQKPIRPSNPIRQAGSAALHVLSPDDRRRSLLRTASHELRTPLNAIIGFSEIIAREMYGPVSDPRYRQHAELVCESGHRLLKLLNQVMELARLATGAADLDLAPEPLPPIFEQVAADMEEPADGKAIDIRVVTEADLPPVMADERALKTILSNLLQNASAFAPEGSEILCTAVLERPGMVRLEIRDQGPGVDPNDLQRLMQPFEQGEAPLTRHAKGAGLGLPIVRLLAEAMGGSLRLASARGEGFAAIVELPAAAASGALEPGPARP